MQKILGLAKSIDLFGVPVRLLDNEKKKNYTSYFGGLLSCCITFISLFYFIYVIYLWNNNQILPSVSSTQQINSYEEFTWSEPIIEFQLQDYVSKINPFTEKNNIITPLLFIIEDKIIVKKPLPIFGTNSNESNTIFINNGTLILNSLNTKDYNNYQKMQQLLLVFTLCQEEFMTDTSNCADNQTIADYMSTSHGLLFVKISLSQLNHVTKDLDVFQKHYYQAFVPGLYTYSQVLMKSQKTTIDDGILFQNLNTYTFLNNFELINQQVDQMFIYQIMYMMTNGQYSVNGLFSFLFRIDNISVIEQISMPKLGQVFAQIGSIIQIIFLLKHLAIFYNETSLDRELYHGIVSMYYPEFKIYRNQGIIFKKDHQLSQSSKLLYEKYKQLLTIAEQKCRLNNIIYEISRIQFILQQQFGIQALMSSHQLGGKIIKEELEENQNLKESNRLAIKPLESSDFKKLSSEVGEPIELLIIQE